MEVRLNTRAAPELIAGRFDAVICATGAVPKRPPIPGAGIPGEISGSQSSFFYNDFLEYYNFRLFASWYGV
ncbi:MAG: hypothetical protein HFF18_06985 [Oscillospiraceae bacterium]|nr:hypothetical protein [Oscillospiraceae bacterium]